MEKEIVCIFCGARFQFKETLERHLATHTKEKHYHCHKCSDSFSVLWTFENHFISQHCNDDSYECQFCLEEFFDKENLKVHQQKVNHEERHFSLERRHAGFLGKRLDLYGAILRHEGKRDWSRFPCSECHKSFRTSFQLKTHQNMHNRQKWFQCEICQKKLASNCSLNSHIAIVHGGKGKCQLCNIQFDTTKQLKLHFSTTHNISRREECVFCSADYINNHNLEKHLRTHTHETPYHCPRCTDSFNQLISLERHYRSRHFENKSHECGICFGRFSMQQDLNSHAEQERHLDKNCYFCQLCKHEYSDRNSLVNHIHKHFIVKWRGSEFSEKKFILFLTSLRLQKKYLKKFQCKDCDKSYRYPNELESHQAKHLGYYRGFRCNICRKRVATRTVLEAHMRSHTGEKPYPCKLCSSAFTATYGLQQHMNLVHSKKRDHKCDQCSRRFAQKNTLNQHKKLHTGIGAYSCKWCKKLFITPSNLRIHISCHTGEKPFPCLFCNKRFALKYGLEIHLRRMHTLEKPYNCSNVFCNKPFSTSNHLLVHEQSHATDGKKPYMCVFCGKRLMHAKSVLVHILAHIGENS